MSVTNASVLEIQQQAQDATTGSTKVEIVDAAGTNKATVKAASTPAQATDPALVVTISPNNSITATASVASVGATGSAVPASADYCGMNVGGTLTGMAGTSNGLKVDGSAVVQPVSAASLPLPAGASTSAKQPALGTAGNASSDVITVQGIASMTALKVDGSGVTQPVSGTVTVNALTNSSVVKAQLQDNSGNGIGSVSVNSRQSLDTFRVGYSNAQFARNAYASVNVTTSAYVQLIASTTNETQAVCIFDSSGQTLKLAIGGSGSEVDYLIIPPGGFDAPRPLNIPASSRISIKAVSASAIVGEIDLQLLG